MFWKFGDFCTLFIASLVHKLHNNQDNIQPLVNILHLVPIFTQVHLPLFHLFLLINSHFRIPIVGDKFSRPDIKGGLWSWILIWLITERPTVLNKLSSSKASTDNLGRISQSWKTQKWRQRNEDSCLINWSQLFSWPCPLPSPGLCPGSPSSTSPLPSLHEASSASSLVFLQTRHWNYSD